LTGELDKIIERSNDSSKIFISSRWVMQTRRASGMADWPTSSTSATMSWIFASVSLNARSEERHLARGSAPSVLVPLETASSHQSMYPMPHPAYNPIGVKGCKALSKGPWRDLKMLWLGTQAITQPAMNSEPTIAIPSAQRVSTISARASGPI
jgi:hypothetical protein